jgi:hypothetical protein
LSTLSAIAVRSPICSASPRVIRDCSETLTQDRCLVHHAEVIALNGESYRLKGGGRS